MLLATAWSATILASSAPNVVARELFGVQAPLVIGALQVALVAGLLVATFFVVELRPLAAYALALLAYAIGNELVEVLKERGALASVEGRPEMLLLGEALLRTIPAAFMLATLLASEIGRRRLFLAVGDPSATASLPLLDRWPWSIAVVPVTILISLPLLVFLAVLDRPDLPRLGQAAELWPAALAFAVVNALQEEIRFRVVPLGLLEPVLGPSHALLISSALFGIGHWSGRPSGPLGAGLAAIAGLLWGRSMLDTRGLVVPWASHAFQDILIFAAAAVSRR